MQIEELQAKDRARWDAYVEASDRATPFALSGWQDVMREALGLRSHYLLARENGRICGVLPLFQVRNPIAGSYYTSMPGGLCTEEDEAAVALLARAEEVVRRSGADYLVLRDAAVKWDYPGLATNEDHCSFVTRLRGDPERILSGTDRCVRQSVRKAREANLEVTPESCRLPEFYPLYARAMHERGTPTQGSRFFRLIMERFPDLFSMVMVRRDGETIGGGLVARFRGRMYQTWAALLPRYYSLGSGYILYWGVLRFAYEQGCESVDLGRSAKDSGTYAFKMHWKPEVRPLYQQFLLHRLSVPPAMGGERESDPRYRLFVEAWRRIPPGMAEWIGPLLRRSIPFG